MALSTKDQVRIDRMWRLIGDKMDPVSRTTIANALRVAADQYERDAKANDGSPRVAARFQEQCDECRAHADQVEL